MSTTYFKPYLCIMSHTFENCRVPELQKYLRSRGVTVTGYNKNLLKELAVAVEKLQLPEDPDYLKDSIHDCVAKKLSLVGLPDCNPFDLKGYTKDFTHIPEFGLIDIFNYMIFSRSDYDGKKLKGYKSYEDYRLFYDGNVELLEFNPLENKNCLFRAKVKPTLKDKTHMNKQFYELWFALDKEDGYVLTGHCECIGGADGACRHLAAALYELEAFEKQSCTEGENPWMKRPRHHDIPVPVRQLSVVKAKFISQANYSAAKPHVDLFDPRLESQRQTTTEDEMKEFGLKLQEVSQNAQVLDILLSTDDRCKSDESGSSEQEDLTKLSIMEKAKEFIQIYDVNNNTMKDMCTKFQNSLQYSSEEILQILNATQGQSSSKFWFMIRQGMLTASNFEKACYYVDSHKEPSKSFMDSILGISQTDENNLPAPLKWGRRKEVIARLLYHRLNKRQHFHMKTKEMGILLSDGYPFLGCSVDGMVTCKCKPPHEDKIIEIKCPYSCRDKNPKEVAVEKGVTFSEKTGKWEVTPECPYYVQIQGQLGLYDLKECDLVIYTKQGIHISTATFDRKFFQSMIEKLILFHQKYIIPNIFQEVSSG